MMRKLLVLILIFLSTLYAQETNDTNIKSFDINQLNMISVTIGGDFIVQGTFPASSLERVDQFITRMKNQAQSTLLSSVKSDKSLDPMLEKINSFAQRDITLKRYDGTVRKIDLLKFRLSGDFENNPYLKNGDVLIFPAYNSSNNFIEIRGAINKPGKYQYVKGDKLSDIIFLAQGINPAFTDVKFAEITRINPTSLKEETIKVNIDDEFALQRGDRIKILSDQIVDRDLSVRVLGEVKNPGEVFITKNSTIYEVIKKAGGLTENASLADAELIRENSDFTNLYWKSILEKYNFSLSSDEIKEIKSKIKKIDALEILRLNNLVVEDTVSFNIDNNLRLLSNKEGIDFTRVTDSISDESKIVVNNGDVIIIPKKDNTVYLWGQIKKAGKVLYKEGENLDYYLDVAGGLTEYAKDYDDIVIIKRGTKEWIEVDDKENIKIAPGDMIYVPKDEPRSIWYYLKRTSSVFSILGTVATIILVFVQASK